MAVTTRKEQYAAGKALRASCSREGHAGWKKPPNRCDPVARGACDALVTCFANASRR